MSTAETSTGTAEEAFATDLSTIVTALMRLRGIERADVMAALHISQGTYYNRLADGNWTAHQMVKLADLFKVDVSDLFGSPDELFRSRCFSPLALVKGGAGQLEMDFDPPARPALAVVGGR